MFGNANILEPSSVDNILENKLIKIKTGDIKITKSSWWQAKFIIKQSVLLTC